MGLLDDLKKQAEELKARDVDRAETLRGNAEAVDRALRHAFKYLNERSQQLKLVKLTCPFAYELPKSGVISWLVFQDFSADYRTKHFMDKDYFGEVILVVRGHSDQVLSIKKSPEEMDRFRDVLWQYNLMHKSEQYRDARRVVTHEIFEVSCEVPLQAKHRWLPDLSAAGDTGAERRQDGQSRRLDLVAPHPTLGPVDHRQRL